MNGTLQKNVLSDQNKTCHLGSKNICYMSYAYIYIYIYLYIFVVSLFLMNHPQRRFARFKKRCPETIPRGTSQALEALKAVQPPIVHAQQMLSVPGNLTDLMLPCQVKTNRTEKSFDQPRDLIVLIHHFWPAPDFWSTNPPGPTGVPVVHLIARKRAQRFGVSTSPLASCWIFTFWRGELNGCNLGCNQSDAEKERKIKTLS